jgi:hypothetical protein
MKLSDAQMDLLVSACQDRLSRLDNAVLQEFEKAMELTFMPYIRTRLEIFDQEGGFSALPGTEIPDTNESGEDALSPRSDSETLPLRDSDTGSFDWPDCPDGDMDRIHALHIPEDADDGTFPNDFNNYFEKYFEHPHTDTEVNLFVA